MLNILRRGESDLLHGEFPGNADPCARYFRSGITPLTDSLPIPKLDPDFLKDPHGFLVDQLDAGGVEQVVDGNVSLHLRDDYLQGRRCAIPSPS